MTRLRFNDGIEFETSGPLRIERRRDGWYVVGQGFLCPVETEDEARAMIEKLVGDADLKEPCSRCGRWTPSAYCEECGLSCSECGSGYPLHRVADCTGGWGRRRE